MRRLVPEMRLDAAKTMVATRRPGRNHGQRNRRRSMAAMDEKRRPCARLGGSRLDSLDEAVEDDETHLTVPSERRGEVWSSDAMGN
jgi:hypothetical protein